MDPRPAGIINAGIIIGSAGGQFWPTPEMGARHVVYPEYLDADTPDEIVKAVRQNMLYGAKVIKICADCKPWGYSVEDIKLVVSEAGKAGLKVEAHAQTVDGARRAIEGGVLVHRPRPRAGRGEQQADGEAGHVPRRHRDAAVADRPPDRGRVQARRGEPEERLGEQGEHHLLHRRRLLRAGKDARRGGDRVHRDLEGGRNPAPRHPQGDDHHRLPLCPDRDHPGADQVGPGRATSSPFPETRWNRSTRSATCSS